MKRFSILKQQIFSAINRFLHSKKPYLINYIFAKKIKITWKSVVLAGLYLIIQIAAPILLIHVGGSPLMGVVFSALWNYRKFHLGSGGKNRAAFSLVFNLVRKIIYANIETLTGPASLCALPIIDLVQIEYCQKVPVPFPWPPFPGPLIIQFPGAPQIDNPFEEVADQGWQEIPQQDADAPQPPADEPQPPADASEVADDNEI